MTLLSGSESLTLGRVNNQSLQNPRLPFCFQTLACDRHYNQSLEKVILRTRVAILMFADFYNQSLQNVKHESRFLSGLVDATEVKFPASATSTLTGEDLQATWSSS